MTVAQRTAALRPAVTATSTTVNSATMGTRRMMTRNANRCRLAVVTASAGRTSKRVIGYEPCDDGNEVQTDGCLTNCILPTCGDGHGRTDVPVERGLKPAMTATRCKLTAPTTAAMRCGDGHRRTDLTEDDEGYEAAMTATCPMKTAACATAWSHAVATGRSRAALRAVMTATPRIRITAATTACWLAVVTASGSPRCSQGSCLRSLR